MWREQDREHNILSNGRIVLGTCYASSGSVHDVNLIQWPNNIINKWAPCSFVLTLAESYSEGTRTLKSDFIVDYSTAFRVSALDFSSPVTHSEHTLKVSWEILATLAPYTSQNPPIRLLRNLVASIAPNPESVQSNSVSQAF